VSAEDRSGEAWLTIGQLAERTEVSVPTLRAWERRHGFPEAKRLPSGHRRYREADAVLIRAVTREREAGLSLPAAIERVQAPSHGEPASVFGSVRARWPELQPYPVVKPAMLALTRAIEDEYLASGQRGVVIGSFQRERHFRESEPRWRELAGTSEATYAFADFKRSAAPAAGPARISIPREHPLTREWAVVIDAPRFCACFASRERARQDGVAGQRVFELIWSLDPPVVRAAIEQSLEVAGESAPKAARGLRRALRNRPLAAPEPMLPTWLTNRMVAYVALLARPGRAGGRAPGRAAAGSGGRRRGR
jgi:DNA-binding transcriptional MerR regulator